MHGILDSSYWFKFFFNFIYFFPLVAEPCAVNDLEPDQLWKLLGKKFAQLLKMKHSIFQSAIVLKDASHFHHFSSFTNHSKCDF